MSLCQGFEENPLTIRAIVIHQYDLLQETFRSAVNNAAKSSFYDRQGFIQVDQHHSKTGQVFGITLSNTPRTRLCLWSSYFEH